MRHRARLSLFPLLVLTVVAGLLMGASSARAASGKASLLIAMAEVASEMYICADTVKTYLSNTYRRLEAAHHGEAVRRARQLGLIRPG